MFIPFVDRLNKKVEQIFIELESEKDIRKMLKTDQEIKNYIVLKLAQNNLLLYTMLTHGRYHPTWAHELLCRKLDKVESGEIKRLIVIVCPRFGKSWLSSVTFPTYYLAKNNNHKFMAVSYNADLVSDFGRDARNIINSETYYDIWSLDRNTSGELKTIPILSKESKAVSRFKLQNGSEYLGQGLGGGVTGRGGNVISCDDWVKSHLDLTGKKMDKDYEWYSSTLYNRQESCKIKGDAAFLVIQTHWHKKDLIGRLLADMESGKGDQWDVFHLQAQATKNEFYDKSEFYYYD